MRHSRTGLSLNVTAGMGTTYVIETPTGVLYLVWAGGSQISFSKSFDRGLTWGRPTSISASSTTVQLSVWYDKWSGLSSGLIHVVWVPSSGDDITYRTIDTENSDALSNEVIALAGSTTAAGASASVCRSRGGNVYIACTIDAGAEGGFLRLLNANVPNGAWAARTTCYEGVGSDQVILMPGFAADNQDMLLFYWDASASEISRKLYDDSANSWAETSIATSMTASTSSPPHWGAAVDLTNSRNLLVAWSAVDALNADLRMWRVTESAITEQTNVVTNSTDDQGGACISVDVNNADKLTVFYHGISSGGQTWPTSVHNYMKKSTDGGANWGSETQISDVLMNVLGGICCVPRAYFGDSPILHWRMNEPGFPLYNQLLAEKTSRRSQVHHVF